MTDKNRFKIVLTEGNSMSSAGMRRVFVDRETGVSYLWVLAGSAGGLTVLLDQDGKPIVTKSVD